MVHMAPGESQETAVQAELAECLECRMEWEFGGCRNLISTN